MFTITDEDRKLRDEGRSWAARVQLNLTQDENKFFHKKGKNRVDTILSNTFGGILQERTALLRLQYREDRGRQVPLVRVIVSQEALVEALADTRMRVMSEENVRKLIYRFVSEDFYVSNLLIDKEGDEWDRLTVSNQRYTEFFLSIRDSL